MSFIYLITKGLEDSFTCGCDTTDSVRYHLRANKIDLSLKLAAQKGAAPLSGAEEQTASAISAHALCACLLSLQMGR